MQILVYLLIALLFTLIFSVIKVRKLIILFSLVIWCSGILIVVAGANLRLDMMALPLIILIEQKFKLQRKFLNSQVSNYRVSGINWFISWLIMSLFSIAYFAPFKMLGYWNLSQYVMGVMVFFKLYKSQNKLDYLKIINFVSLPLSILYIILDSLKVSYLSFFALNIQLRSDHGNFVGFSFERNLLASQALLIIALNIYYGITNKRIFLASNAAMLVIIILAQTRSVWIALGIMTLVFLKTRSEFVKKIILASILILFVVLYFAVQLRVDKSFSVNEKFDNLFNTSSGTGGYRISIYGTAIKEVFSGWASTLFGFGIGTFGYIHSIDTTHIQAQYISSIWVAVLHSSGLVGLILFIGAIVRVYINSENRLRTAIVFISLFVPATTTTPFLLAFPWVGIGLLSSKSIHSES